MSESSDNSLINKDEHRQGLIKLREQELLLRSEESKMLHEQALTAMERQKDSEQLLAQDRKDVRDKKLKMFLAGAVIMTGFVLALALTIPAEERGGIIMQLLTHAFSILGGFGGGIYFVLRNRQ